MDYTIEGLRQTAKRYRFTIARLTTAIIVALVSIFLSQQLTTESQEDAYVVSGYGVIEDITERDGGHWELVTGLPQPTLEKALGELSQARTVTPPPSLSLAARPPVEPAGTDALLSALARSPWPQHLWDEVIQIATCESTLNPSAVGDGGLAIGLMQVRSDAHPEKLRVYNPWTYEGSLELAWWIYLEAGRSFWGPWRGCYVPT